MHWIDLACLGARDVSGESGVHAEQQFTVLQSVGHATQTTLGDLKRMFGIIIWFFRLMFVVARRLGF